jgi:hypothetical protein
VQAGYIGIYEVNKEHIEHDIAATVYKKSSASSSLPRNQLLLFHLYLCQNHAAKLQQNSPPKP